MSDFFKKNSIAVVLFFIVVAGLAFSLGRFALKHPGERRIMYFQSMDTDSIVCENRYIKTEEGMDEVEAFVDELLLGPMTNRFVRLFPLGTKTESCFVKDDILYVNLSKEALLTSPETCSVKDGVRLLKENVVKNFTYINTVDVFIDGVSVGE